MNQHNKFGMITFVLVSLIVVSTGVYWSQSRGVWKDPFAVTPTLVNTPVTSVPAPDGAPSGPVTPSLPCHEDAAALPTPFPGTPFPKAPPKVDILFLLDATSSMEGSIEGVQNNIKAFVAEFQQRKMDARVGLIAFRDRTNGEEPQMLTFNGQIFTSDTICFSDAVGKLIASGGGDEPESALDALVLGAHQPFRRDAGRKVIVLITDAPPKVPDKDTQSIDDAIQTVRASKITFLYFIVNNADIYGQIRDKTGLAGGILPLADAVTGKVNFDQLLPEIAKRVAGS